MGILGFIAIIGAIVGLVFCAKVNVGIGIMAAPYIIFKVIYCLRSYEELQKISERLKK